MKKVLYSGSFDPITRGHMNVIDQASELFDEVVVAVMKNEAKKNPFFTLEERVDLIEKIYEGKANIKVVSGEGATVDIAIENECKAIVRGLRGVTDFEYEIQLAEVNKQISNNEINTVCLFPDNGYQYISSSVVREVFGLNKDIDRYVVGEVKEAMIEKQKVYKKGR